MKKSMSWREVMSWAFETGPVIMVWRSKDSELLKTGGLVVKWISFLGCRVFVGVGGRLTTHDFCYLFIY